MDFVYFLGRLHVLFLHIPIGVILIAVIADWLARRPRFAALERASTLLWGVAAISALLALATGLMHVTEGDFDPASAGSHRFWAIVTTVGATAVWLVRLKASAGGALARAIGAFTLLTMLLTLFFGSRLTHGERFLGARLGTLPAVASVANSSPFDEDRTPSTRDGRP